MKGDFRDEARRFEDIDKAVLAKIRSQTMTKHTPIWTLWNGYGPHPDDGLMRCVRIGPEKGGGLRSSFNSADIEGTKDDMEHCVLAYNATYAAGINPEAVGDMRKALDHCRNVIAEHLRKPGNDLNGFMRGALGAAKSALAKASQDA